MHRPEGRRLHVKGEGGRLAEEREEGREAAKGEAMTVYVVVAVNHMLAMAGPVAVYSRREDADAHVDEYASMYDKINAFEFEVDERVKAPSAS